jgi:iron complex transport system permease protein
MSRFMSRFMFCLLLLLGANILLLLANLVWGSVAMTWGELWAVLLGGGDATQSAIIWRLRLPNALMSILAGGGLAVAGLLMQTFFRNPIASPYLLGVSAGAGLGVAMGLFLFGGLSAWWVAAFGAAGSAGVLLLLLAASFRLRDDNSLLILGIMLGSVIGAVVELLQYFASAEALQRYTIWTQGSVQGSHWAEVLALLPILFVVWIWVYLQAKGLDGLLFGRAYAESMGVNVEQLRRGLIIATALLSGGITAFCGPVGFVGLIAPHGARWLLRSSRHKELIPITLLLGVFILLAAGALSVLLSNQRPLPLNALTALLGVPLVIWLLWRR